jgi:hypothetical protein
MARNIQQHAGGAYSADCQIDIMATDPLQAPIQLLTGTTDVINPYNPNGNNYIANNAAAPDLTTLIAPVAGADDGLSIAFYSASAFAHKITSTGNISSGTSSANSIALAAFAGAGVILRAYNGKWQIIGSNAALTLA